MRVYGKLFASMFDGSLYGNWQAIVTFQQMIILCDADGVVDITPQALAARTSIPLDIIKEGLKVLEAPDAYSRTPDQDGRRIELLDEHRPWGWKIVNYAKYRMLVSAETIKEQNRLRQQRKRERDATVTGRDESVTGRDCNAGHASSRKITVSRSRSRSTTPKPPQAGALFGDFWSAYPRKEAKGRAEKAFAKIQPDAEVVAKMIAGIERAKGSDQWSKDGGKFIPHPATWLNDRGWEDGSAPVNGSAPKDDWWRHVV